MLKLSRSHPELSPRASSAFLFLLSVFVFIAFLCFGSWWCIAAVIPLIIINHVGHESVHGCFAFRGSKRVNYACGWVAYALVGQNFIFMRWSHLSHHRFGRTHPEETIDACSASKDLIYYYAALFGASNYYHEIAGYLYPLLGTSKFHILDRSFSSKFYRSGAYIMGQAWVLLVNTALWWTAGLWLIPMKIIFSLYWGGAQNIAHYGLPVGQYAGSQFASRTYRVPDWLSFLSFGSTFHHLEHHLFPAIPGPRLSSKMVQEALVNQHKIDEPISGNLRKFVLDCLRQYKGPMPES